MARYFAKKTECAHGHKHASAKEAKRCHELHLLQDAGKIIGLKVEPRFYFQVNGRDVKMRNGQVARYSPDFTYVCLEKGVQVAEEVKASNRFIQEAAALRMALFRATWPSIELRVIA